MLARTDRMQQKTRSMGFYIRARGLREPAIVSSWYFRKSYSGTLGVAPLLVELLAEH